MPRTTFPAEDVSELIARISAERGEPVGPADPGRVDSGDAVTEPRPRTTAGPSGASRTSRRTTGTARSAATGAGRAMGVGTTGAGTASGAGGGTGGVTTGARPVTEAGRATGGAPGARAATGAGGAIDGATDASGATGGGATGVRAGTGADGATDAASEPGGASDARAMAAAVPIPVTPSRRALARLVPLVVGAVVMLIATSVLAVVPPASSTPSPPPPPPAPGGPVPAADSAAATQGWTLVGGDEFDGGRSALWGDYEGEGHNGSGSRTPAAVTVADGALVIRGDAEGNTGGTAWKGSQRFGKWEVRARFPRGDAQYHPVLLLWPTDRGWPEGGEIDFAETDSAAPSVSFFLHHGPGNQQLFATRDIDITQWHHYAVDWVDGRVTGYLDGVPWFESTDPAVLPPGEMHPAIQLDYVPTGAPAQPSEMHVDHLRVYR